MFKLIARTALGVLAATAVANAAPPTTTGHVTFVDNASGQILVDNQLVGLDRDLSGADLRLGDEVALLFSDDVVTAILAPASTGATSKSVPPSMASTDEAAAGIVTCVDATGGIVVLDNSVVLTVDGSSIGMLRLGQMAEARYSEIAGLKLAGAITTLE